MLSGTVSAPPRWCHPALSHTSTAYAPKATWVLISIRCSFIASVLAAGMMMAAPAARAAHSAPNK